MIARELAAQTPVFVLCGGLGTRLKEETEFRPKPMVPIGDKPILWHIMHSYSQFGFRKFVLCAGFKSEVIKDYFLNYSSLNSDFTVNLRTNDIQVHSMDSTEDWEVTVVFTGDRAMTGARIARASSKFLGNAQHAAVTYGDGLCDVNLLEEYQFHLEHGRLGTVLGVNPPSRFGELRLEEDRVLNFSEKPQFSEKWINGGYFFFQRDFFKSYLVDNDSCVLEQAPLVRLAEDRELRIYRHRGFWACMDTQRDRDQLNEIWAKGQAPWLPSLSFTEPNEVPELALTH